MVKIKTTNKMSQITKYRIALFLLGVIIVFVLFHKCDSKVVMPKEPDTKIIQINIDSVKILKGQIKLLEANKAVYDSLNKIHKAKYLALKNTNRERIVYHICDTVEVLKYYDSTVNSCDSVIHSDSLVISNRDNTIIALNKVVTKQSDIINEVKDHDAWQKSVNDILKKEVKKQKRTKIAVICGAILGVVATIVFIK